MGKCPVCKVVTFLGGLGALNWLLVAFFNYNLVATFLGDMTLAAKIVYALVGVSGGILIISIVKTCPCCKTKT